MTYVVAVRTLCEFTARRGDLDLRFTPAPSALEGIAGHQAVTARRASGYEAEITLTGTHGGLTVRGRADGYDRALNRLEEIKTHRGDLERMPANHRALHWAQALVYGHLLCEARALDALTVALVYFDIASQKETVLTEQHTAASLRAFFEDQCERFVAWAARETAHRDARNTALNALRFPYGEFRSGQRELSVAVFRAARDGRCLMAQAPTGIGKTLGTIFPLLKACGADHLDRVFFLTAKTPGRALALEAIESLHRGEAALPLRTLELVARDKACEHPDKSCDGDSCPLARGFYDRLPAARDTALQARTLDRAAVREAALAHGICPYYLAQEMARWCDVVIGDYNYYFDSSAMLYALTQLNGWRVAVLADEAHNLPDRARRMYSATLDQHAFRGARHAAPAALKKPFDRLNREWNALNRERRAAYEVLPDVPPKLQSALQNLIASIGDQLAETPQSVDENALRFYFDALHFMSLVEQFGDHSIVDVTLETPHGAARAKPATQICVRNVIPAPFLKPRYAAARATIVFSGTLSPQHFYRDMLGLPADTGWVDVEGPFRSEQLNVRVAHHVSTRWRDRERSLEPIVDLIAQQYAARPGNYLGFLSSFDYLQRVAGSMRERHPQVPIWTQEPRMDERARDAFLARFATGGAGVGFAVLGGAFSEGIDLVGERLIGAFIATLGLPQMNDVNEQMRRTFDAQFGNGYDYAYLFPGMQKVVQAAGRVIRTEHDAGVVHLIDDRYRRADVKRLLPRWWKIAT
ncbi:ATP-dependent DNA helicase [Paraburkholderia caribensis]|uniref:ATP-dependent DNA helicase n=2 Tax=Pseudomonadota TaxID=1224 RepID=A0A9Q6WMS2_9BURK|nr:ATP-dependent DNA helicase [Paraburkholderia caribensis]MCO4877711.1 ATP-dependent DNA helicase [Paraburkholderia caribensis]PTB28139.1 ATP-dependent DNA helicase [Paraburkholderia caribensis]QLB64292.1 ATP-dependent DNA helicase [Paraburkholderia caribensis]